MRKYILHDPLLPDGKFTIKCNDDHDCVFCKFCTDIYWDYSNLIYGIVCEADHNPWKRPCKYFVEGEKNDK